jgi:hypothetical protein
MSVRGWQIARFWNRLIYSDINTEETDEIYQPFFFPYLDSRRVFTGAAGPRPGSPA